LNNYRIDDSFRCWKHLPEDVISRLQLLIDETPDAMSDYVSEIHRLERISLEKRHRIYRNRLTGFDWKYAMTPMRLKT
jgi:hypothetical protein